MSLKLPNRQGPLEARVVKVAQPLLGVEKDEITDMVNRIKRADARARTPVQQQAAAPIIKEEDEKWAQEWKLPQEVFEYFILERQ